MQALGLKHDFCISCVAVGEGPGETPKHGGMDSSNDMAWHRKSTTGPGLPELQVSKPTGIWSRPSSTLPNAETAEVPRCLGTDHILVARACYGRAQSQRSDEVNEADGTSPCFATE